ncbi:MAG: glycosyl hydrolase family 18 protein [Eubacteriales bacterium]
MEIYIVKPVDSVYSIAQKYGVTPQSIIDNNAISDDSRLMAGQALVIVLEDIKHRVTAGQSLYSIARMYGTTVSNLLAANPGITNPAQLQIGQIVTVPRGAQQKRTIDVNGYAFPSINRDVLSKTLPNLTYLSIFSYTVKPNGTLSTINDTPLITAARGENVAPIMVITNIIEGEGFDSDLAHVVLTDTGTQDVLLNNIVEILNSKNYYGLDIDFEYVYPQDREAYNAFLRKTVAKLRPLGYAIITSIAPKLNANQPGLLYEAHDYPVHGALLDHVVIMTYEWGYTYGPAQAVSPIDQVEKVLQYAVSVIPSKKILMGMPNYGYDWTLPFVEGSSARSMSNLQAIELAQQVGAQIQYDEKSQAPFFNYYDSEGRQHVVWFDDARSIRARLRLVEKYNLGGVSYWTINFYFPQNWIVLNSMYNVNKVL